MMAIVGKSSKNKAHVRNKWIVTSLVSLFLLYTFVPIFYLVVASTKNAQDLFTTFGLWFADTNNIWGNIQDVFTFQEGAFGHWLWNSAWYSTVTAVGSALISSAAGYAFAKLRFPGRNILFGAIIAAVMIPGTALVIPLFLMLTKMGLVDTYWAVILPSLVFPLGVYLMRVYSEQGIPTELVEAARIDGAGELTIFFRIGLRLIAPGFVTVLILSFVGSWNNYFLPLVVLTTPEKLPLTVGLTNWYEIAVSGLAPKSLFPMVMMGSLISVIPIIAVFILLQRFWQSGLTAGGVK